MAPPSSSTDPLNAASLSSFIAASLPPDASPHIRTPTDAIAIACHAGMLAVGFRLLGLGEEHTIPATSQRDAPEPLPTEWTQHHAFRYAHSQSSMQYLLRISKLGVKTVINGIGMGDDKTASFDLTTADYISPSALPCTLPSSSTSEDRTHTLTNIFISPSRLTDLGALLRLNLIQKLVPGLQKEGYEESTSSSSADPRGPPTDPATHPLPRHDPLREPNQPTPARPHPLADPSVGPAARPRVPPDEFAPPGFDDEYDMLRAPGRGGPRFPGAPGAGFPRIGDRDLYPPGMGPNDPLRIGPRRGGGGGGGMHPTFEDFGAPDEDPTFGGRAPPGARFDPPGPFGPARGGMGGGGPGGFFGGGGGGFL